MYMPPISPPFLSQITFLSPSPSLSLSLALFFLGSRIDGQSRGLFAAESPVDAIESGEGAERKISPNLHLKAAFIPAILGSRAMKAGC